jgi:serine/threonine-protein kinase RsbW
MQMSAKVTLARDGRFVAVARGVLGSLLDGVPAPTEVVDDLQMALSEACANVVRHATTSRAFDVDVEVEPERCQVQVVDHGPGFVPRPGDFRPGGWEEEAGRGLALMQALTDELSLDRVADGMCVRFVRTW